MPEFKCTVCGAAFSLSDETLAKYPGWTPKYCREHSPKKGAASGSAAKAKPDFKAKFDSSTRVSVSRTGELDLPLAEVLQRFTEGPDTGIFTDGSARPNPGPGGWGTVYVRKGEIIEQAYGKESSTTNNRMELTGLIAAYKMITAADEIDIYSDSELCVNTINQWASGWEAKGWKKKSGPIKNLELVQEAYALARQRPKAKLLWIKAHNGWLWNEYADSLSTAWARSEL